MNVNTFKRQMARSSRVMLRARGITPEPVHRRNVLTDASTGAYCVGFASLHAGCPRCAPKDYALQSAKHRAEVSA